MPTKETNKAASVRFKPLAGRVLIQRLEAEETLKGGIILPDSAKKKQETARVIRVGDGKRSESGKVEQMPVKPGDTVLLDKYSGQEITLEGEEFLIVRQDEIIAIIES